MNSIATSINTNIANNNDSYFGSHAAEFVKATIGASIKISCGLTEKEFEILQRDCEGLSILLLPKKKYVSHGLAAAYREVVRQIFLTIFDARITNVLTLILGSSSREYNLYKLNLNVFFQLYLSEDKDVRRIVLPFMEELIANTKVDKSKIDEFKQIYDCLKPDERKVENIQKICLEQNYEISMVTKYFMLFELKDIVVKMNQLSFDNIQIPRFNYRDDQLPKVVNLVAEDCIYNQSPDDIAKIFVKTGAINLFGYAIFDLKVVIPDCLDAEGFNFRRYRDHVTGKDMTALTFLGDNSNGYSHVTEHWHAILSKPVWGPYVDDNDREFCLVVEIVKTVGPFCIFTIVKSTTTANVVREIQVPAHRQAILVLDLEKSFDYDKMCMKYDKIYFPISLKSFVDITLYAHSLNANSFNFGNLVTYIRRKLQDIGVGNRSLISCLDIRSEDVIKIARVVYCHVVNERYQTEGFINNVNNNSLWSWFTGIFTKVINSIGKKFSSMQLMTYIAQYISNVQNNNLQFEIPQVIIRVIKTINLVAGDIAKFFTGILGVISIPLIPIYVVLNWFTSDHNNYKLLVKETSQSKFQDATVYISKHRNAKFNLEAKSNGEYKIDDNGKPILKIETKTNDNNVITTTTYSDKQDIELCPICSNDSYKKTFGEYPMECHHKEDSVYHFKITENQMSEIKTKMLEVQIDTTGAPPEEGLTELKKKAADKLVSSVDKHVNIQFIMAGPGCGKSTLIRALFKTGDGILIPFRKLKDDYKEQGNVFTTHLALINMTMVNTLYVDECSATDLNIVAALVGKCNIQRVVFVGDEQQCKLLAVEGYGVLNLDYNDFSWHYMTYNFRLTKSVCDLTNGVSKHRMVPVREEVGKIRYFSMNCDNANPLVNKIINYYHSSEFDDYNDFQIGFLRQERINLNVTPYKTMEIIKGLITKSSVGYRNQTICSFPGVLQALDKGYTYLTCSYASKALHPNCAIARSAQGTTIKGNVCIFLTAHDNFLINDPGTRCVITSRGTGDLVIVGQTICEVQNFIDKYDPMLVELVLEQAGVSVMDTIVQRQAPLEIITPVNSTEAPDNDAYLHVKDMVQSIADRTIDRINVPKVTALSKNINVGVDLVTPINQRGNLKNLEKASYQLGASITAKFTADNLIDQIATIEARVGDIAIKSRKLMPMVSGGDLLAAKMVDYYFSKCKSIVKLSTDSDKATVVNKMLRDSRIKAYWEKYCPLLGEFKYDVVFSFVKTTIKVPNSTKDSDDMALLGKPGLLVQGWDSILCARFAIVCRMLQFLDKESDKFDTKSKNFVITDDGWSDVEFTAFVNRSYALLNPISRKSVIHHHVMDGIKFDTVQGEFTQRIEYYYYLKLGISKEWINLIMHYRNHKTLINGEIKAKTGTTMGSGNPITKMGNGVVEKVPAFYLLSGGDKNPGNVPFVMVYKGDDFCYSSPVKFSINQIHRSQIRQFSNFDVKASFTQHPEFCGYVASDTGFYPNIYRRLRKCADMQFRDYIHFCEYQKSLRDFIDSVQHYGSMSELYDANAKATGFNREDYVHMYATICSLSHIGEDQFYDQFDKVFAQPQLPLRNGEIFI